MLQTFILIALVVLLVATLALLWTLRDRLREIKDERSNDKSLLMLNQNIQGMSERLDKNTESLNSRLDKAAQIIGGVAKELGAVQERFKGFEEFSDLLHPDTSLVA